MVKLIACLFVSVAMVLCMGCDKKEEAKQEPAAAEKPAKAEPAKAEEPKPQASAIDERLKPHFEAGQDCKWNEYGMAMCKTSSAIRKVAFNNQSDSKLAASCTGALTHADIPTRGLAAECMGGFNDRARIPHLAAGLDAFEKEKDPGVRAAIARAFSKGNAKESGVEDRVIQLVRKLAGQPDGQICASYLIDSMFPRYLMQGTKPPSKEAGDLAMEMATKEGRLGTRALAALGLLSDRGTEACKVLVEVAKGKDWSSAVESISSLKDACSTSLDPVIDHIAKELKGGTFRVSEYSATRKLLKKVPLTKKHIKKLKGASRVRAKKERKTAFAKSSKELADSLKKYKPPK